MELKPFQAAALETLEFFLRESRLAGPAAAYDKIKARGALGTLAGTYTPHNGQSETPYCCIRIPTGGGKTLLAAHSIRVASDAWMERDRPIVLWLVPSNVIRSQTVDALKSPSHPYRRAIDEAFGGNVRVFDISEYRTIRPADLSESVCVVVGTIQTLRVQNTEGRKVYEDDENLEPHFASVDAGAGLERNDEGPRKGDIRYSFANLLHLQRPLLIVDEAHQAVTSLSREMQDRINPACIVEFTATPRAASNIIVNVPAMELKAADLIKLPIILADHQAPETAIAEAIKERNRLAEIAKGEPHYVRPIVLFQAQNADQPYHAEEVKRLLIEQEGIAASRIAIATGDKRELDDIDLFRRDCPIEYIVTVQALREGWDCSFAYVFCSVANIQSAEHVEQLLGRVLRMPYATRRKAPELNRAYAHVSGTKFTPAAVALCDSLVKLGFDEAQAAEQIEIRPQLPLPGGGPLPIAAPAPETFVLESVPDLGAVPPEARAIIKIETRTDGKTIATIAGPIGSAVTEAIVNATPVAERTQARFRIAQNAAAWTRAKAAVYRGEKLRVPQLCVWHQGELALAERESFLEIADWNPLRYPAALSEAEFKVQPESGRWVIDLIGGTIKVNQADSNLQLDLDLASGEWNESRLSVWIDRLSRRVARDWMMTVTQPQSLEFIGRALADLLSARGMEIGLLVRLKYPLASAIVAKFKAAYAQAIKDGFDKSLFAPEAKPETTFTYAFEFPPHPHAYPATATYQGKYKPMLDRHYYPQIGDMNEEEAECAVALSFSKHVKHWVRNIEARPDRSFWLPTSTDRFYPDFVAELTDGRVLAVEYKGERDFDPSKSFISPDAREKRTIGELWESKSGGKALFLMAAKSAKGLNAADQIRSRIETLRGL